MTTLAPAEVTWYAKQRVAQRPGAVFSGIVGNLAHRVGGGYHISIEDQPATNYSVTRPDDKAPPGNWPRNMASAVDRSQPKAQMIDAWNKMYTLWLNRAWDTRAQYINAYNGWNGRGEAERLDFVAGTRSIASPDHKTHDHEERRRRYVNSRTASLALLSADRGETHDEYLASIGQAPTEAQTAQGDDGMLFYYCSKPNGADGERWAVADLAGNWREFKTQDDANDYSGGLGRNAYRLTAARWDRRKTELNRPTPTPDLPVR